MRPQGGCWGKATCKAVSHASASNTRAQRDSKGDFSLLSSKKSVLLWPNLITYVEGQNYTTENYVQFQPGRDQANKSQNQLGSKRLLRSSSLTYNPTPPWELDHGTECHIQPLLKHLQGQ